MRFGEGDILKAFYIDCCEQSVKSKEKTPKTSMMAPVKLRVVLWVYLISCVFILFGKAHECVNPVEYELLTKNLMGEKVLKIEVELGNNAYFKSKVFNEGNHYSYIKFGRHKKGEMHPDPLLMRIDKIKVTYPYKLYDDSKLKYTGNLNDGIVCIIMKNINFNDEGAYAIYTAEEDGSGNDTKKLRRVIIELKVHNYSANHITIPDASLSTGQSTIINSNIIPTSKKLKNASFKPDHKNDSSEPVPMTTPVKTANTTSSPTQADNQPTPTGDLIKIIVGVGVSLVVVVIIILCIIYRRKIMNWWRQKFGQRKLTDAEDNAFELDVSVATDGKLDPNLEDLLVKTEEERGGEAL